MGFNRWAKVAILLMLGVLEAKANDLKVGAARLPAYLSELKQEQVGVVANHTARINGVHLVDTLLSRGINIQQIFAPEHGFRGDHGAGATIEHGKDTKTGIPVFSLYGATKKPTPESLQGITHMVFDIQDVGCRFYTYISTLHYVMEACAEAGIPLTILDRPNPNGHYIAGPVLDTAYRSFVGMHPVPVVYGMTIGEYAKMINGQGWLKNQQKCRLRVIQIKSYTHEDHYQLPIAPSPNLPNQKAIVLYPSLCFFEGTPVSVGRGTAKPFQVIGRPGFEKGNTTFKPRSIPGKAANPPYEGQLCRGFDLQSFADSIIAHKPDHLFWRWLIKFYKDSEEPSDFFEPYFKKLAGTDKLQKLVRSGATPAEIRKHWKDERKAFKSIREQYLLYPDFD